MSSIHATISNPGTAPTQGPQRIEYEGTSYDVPSWASVDEYRAIEDSVPFKIEFLNGVLRAMAGGSPDHSLIGLNIGGELRSELKETRCVARSSDQKVRAPSAAKQFYPDVTVVCGSIETAEDDPHAITNPTLVVEVLSPSTANYDQREKYDAYITIPSLREYVLVHYDTHRVERFVRDGDDWKHYATVGPESTVEFASVPAAVPMTEIYRGVDLSRFDQPPGEAGEGGRTVDGVPPKAESSMPTESDTPT